MNDGIAIFIWLLQVTMGAGIVVGVVLLVQAEREVLGAGAWRGRNRGRRKVVGETRFERAAS